MTPLKIGDAIEFDGKTYIVFFVTTCYDREGMTIRLEGMDPLRAQQHMEDQAKRRVSLENQDAFKELLPDLKRALGDPP